MKKIYTLAILLMLSLKAFTQTDMAILHTVQTGDTFTIQSVNPPQEIIIYAFVNHGPNALTATDTIFLRTPYTQTYFKLNLLNINGIAVGDTAYFTDTIGLTSGTAQGNFNWCDSIWVKNVNSVIIADPVIANNKTCNTVYINNLTLSISETFGTTKTTGVSGLNVYPNPAVSSISFEYYAHIAVDASVYISDMVGRRVYHQELGEVYGDQKVNIDINSLNAGIYIVELKVGEKKQVGRFVINK